MKTITPRTRPTYAALTDRRAGAAERRSAHRRRRVNRGVVASYLHDISARHTPTAPAV